MTDGAQQFYAERVPAQFNRALEETLRTEGEEGHKYYLIRSGSVGILQGGAQVCQLGAHDTFGEVALLRVVRDSNDDLAVAMKRLNGILRTREECGSATVRPILVVFPSTRRLAPKPGGLPLHAVPRPRRARPSLTIGAWNPALTRP